MFQWQLFVVAAFFCAMVHKSSLSSFKASQYEIACRCLGVGLRALCCCTLWDVFGALGTIVKLIGKIAIKINVSKVATDAIKQM